MQKGSPTARVSSLEGRFVEINQTFGLKRRGRDQNWQTSAEKIKVLDSFQLRLAKSI